MVYFNLQLYRWNQAAQNFIAFIRCLNRRAEWRIFEMYLKQLPLPPDELQELESETSTKNALL